MENKRLLVLIVPIISFFLFSGIFNYFEVESRKSRVDTPKFKVSIRQEGKAVRTEFKSGNAGVEFTVNATGAEMKKSGDTTTFDLPTTQLKYEIKKEGSMQGLKETITLKDKNAPAEITFSLKLENIDSFTPDPEKRTWKFFNKQKKEVFYIPAGFMIDSKGVKSNAVNIAITKDGEEYLLKVTADKNWLDEPTRAYPVEIDPSVIVSGGISDSNVQFANSQRKLVSINNNWYAFYTSSNKVWYKKSADGAAWGEAVDVDNTGSNKINPSVYLLSNLIYVAWVDTGNNKVEVNTINTASSDNLGAKCTSPSPGTLGSSYTVSVAVANDGTVYLTTTDTSSGTSEVTYKLTYSGCTFADITAPYITSTILRPSGDSTVGINKEVPYVCNPGCEAQVHWNRINDAVADDNTSYAYNIDSVNSTDYYSLTSYSKFTNENITSIDVTSRVMFDAGGNNNGYVKVGVSLDGQDVLGATRAPTSWTTYTESNLARPGGGSWTMSDLSRMRAVANVKAPDKYLVSDGCGGWTTVYPKAAITQLYVTVHFTRNIPKSPILLTTGNTLHKIFQDGNLSHSIYDGSSWLSDNNNIATDSAGMFSATTDGTNIWLISADSTGSRLYKYNGSSWSQLVSPFPNTINITSLSITYDSVNSDLYVAVILSGLQAYYKSTDATTISWNNQSSFNFTAGDLGQISLPMIIASAVQLKVILRQGSNLEIAGIAPQPVIVSGGIAETDTQFGGMQRKVIYMNGAWYAFYSQNSDVWYKKSVGGKWSSVKDVDPNDASNFNPTIYSWGNYIYVAWIDTSSNTIEVNRIDASNSDTLGTKCTSPSPGTLGNTYLVSLAVATDGTVYVAASDTGGGQAAVIYKLIYSDCTFTSISSTTSSEILRPNAAGDATLFWRQPAGNNWDKVSEAIADDASTYVYQPSNGGNQTDYYNLDDTGLSSQTISSIDVTVRGSTVENNGYVQGGVRIGTNNIFGNNHSSGSWTTFTDYNLTKPGGGSWTTTDLNSLQVALHMTSGYHLVDDGCGGYINVYASSSATQIFTTVNYYTNNSMLTAGSRPVLVTAGNNLHVIYQDGDLTDSIYDGYTWRTQNATIAAVLDNNYSVTTDGTNVWVLSHSSGNDTNYYKYNGSSWSTLAAPFTGQTNLSSVSLTYDTSSKNIYASVIMDDSEQAYYKQSDSTTTSWSPQSSFFYAAGDLGQLSTPLSVSGISLLGAVARQSGNLEFSSINSPPPPKSIFIKGVRLRGKNRL